MPALQVISAVNAPLASLWTMAVLLAGSVITVMSVSGCAVPVTVILLSPACTLAIAIFAMLAVTFSPSMT